MAGFKNLPRKLDYSAPLVTCTTFRAMEKVFVLCVSLPQRHLGRWAAWNGTSPISASKVILRLFLNSCETTGYPPTPFIWKNKTKTTLKKPLFLKQTLLGASLPAEPPAHEQPRCHSSANPRRAPFAMSRQLCWL